MKLNDLVGNFTIAMSNEEKKVLSKIEGIMRLDTFEEREQVIIENLIRKSLVSKVHKKDGSILVMANEI
jgi:hypothetical protein